MDEASIERRSRAVEPFPVITASFLTRPSVSRVIGLANRAASGCSFCEVANESEAEEVDAMRMSRLYEKQICFHQHSAFSLTPETTAVA